LGIIPNPFFTLSPYIMSGISFNILIFNQLLLNFNEKIDLQHAIIQLFKNE